MKKKYNVIVVGAGPAGLSTAINLLDNGVKDILVVERAKFPRYKCCAGYITNKTKTYYEKLGINFKDCHYNLIKDFKIFYKLKERQVITNKFLYTNQNIDRTELDNAFFVLARKKKVKIVEEAFVVEIDKCNNMIALNDGSRYEYNYLVFADGTSGIGSKFQDYKKKNIALQLIIPNKIEDKIEIHFGITKKGYGWVSTYNGVTNIGLTDVYNSNINYKDIFEKFLKDLKIKGDLKNLTGAFTPIGTRKPIINKNIYFVGDAVGACDPLTLSGLRYALASGEKCAIAIAKGNNKIYKQFINKLKLKFILMQGLQKMFYLKITLFCIFNIGCNFFNKLIAFVFNHFFVNKK